jgi:hypothetical protein
MQRLSAFAVLIASPTLLLSPLLVYAQDALGSFYRSCWFHVHAGATTSMVSNVEVALIDLLPVEPLQ